MIDRDSHPMGVFADYEGCDSGIETQMKDRERFDDMWDPASEFNPCLNGMVHKFYFDRLTGETTCIICDQNILDCANTSFRQKDTNQ